MLFQPLDSKGKCVGYYADGELFFKEIPQNADKTWYYSSSLKDREVEYARIYCGGKSLTEVCPLELKPAWEKITKKLHAFLKSFRTAKLNLSDLCLYDLVPEFFLYEFSDTKNSITNHIFANFARPKNHNFLVNVIKMIADIKQQKLNIDLDSIRPKLVSVAGKNFIQRLQTSSPVVDYNPFGTVTGRLTTMRDTFPILTLNKEFRGCLHPNNDWFLELDYNAAEIRTLLALSGLPQPKGDIHEWNRKHVYKGEGTRDEVKKRIFAWLYNSKSEDQLSSRAYDKELVKNKYWDGQTIITEFDREIKDVDDHHALNYIIQSTTSDLVLSKALLLHERLADMESRIAFMMHDSIVIDLKNSERSVIIELLQLFGNTRFGKYKVNLSLGKNFGDMKRTNL
jgi:hypothetical protein